MSTAKKVVKNYAEAVRVALDEKLEMSGTPYEGLLDFYGLLVLTVGKDCTQKHIHDAWSLWQNQTQPEHRSLIPFEELSREVQEFDEKYRVAVVEVALSLIA